jgi:cysteine desulfurase
VASGTEAVNLALFGISGPLLTWAAEHQSVLAAARRMQSEGREVTIAGVDSSARVDPDAIKPGIALVSVGLANNEVGTIQPVREVIERAHDAGAIVHLDACAGPRWFDVPPGADLVSFSGHKLGAGRGGLLFVRDGVRLDPLLYGGPQEWGRRAGFEDVAAATAVAIALSVCARERVARSRAAYSQALALTLVMRDVGGRSTGAEERLPNVASCTFANRRGEDLLLALDLAGVAASSGSACASGSLDPSHVLLAMGRSLEEALGSLRLSTGYATTDADVVRAGEVLYSVFSRARSHA